jgi:hypothetical protein
MIKLTKNTRFEAGPIAKGGRLIFGAAGLNAAIKPPAGVGFPMNLAIMATYGVASLATGGLSTLNLKRHQKYRDQRADKIFKEISSSNSHPAYTLYLRSFDTTGKLLEILEKKTVLPFTYDDTDLETYIACAVEPFAPLIALGREKGEQIGAGRIVSDGSTWQKKLTLLAKKAQLIFLIPFDSDGIKLEIQFIQSYKLFKKTIFIMPPQAVKKMDWEKRWEKVSNSIKDLGFKLPAYNPQGMLFSMQNRNTLNCTDPFAVEKDFRKMNKKLKSFCNQVLSA